MMGDVPEVGGLPRLLLFILGRICQEEWTHCDVTDNAGMKTVGMDDGGEGTERMCRYVARLE
jgi:hypothetical protein